MTAGPLSLFTDSTSSGHWARGSSTGCLGEVGRDGPEVRNCAATAAAEERLSRLISMGLFAEEARKHLEHEGAFPGTDRSDEDHPPNPFPVNNSLTRLLAREKAGDGQPKGIYERPLQRQKEGPDVVEPSEDDAADRREHGRLA